MYLYYLGSLRLAIPIDRNKEYSLNVCYVIMTN